MNLFQSMMIGAMFAAFQMLATAESSRAQVNPLVADEYAVSCQVCHGKRGKGDGPMAAALKTKPSDLTKLSEKNDFKFPFLKVFQIVDGRSIVSAHGTREMPVWGQRYAADIGEKYGPYGGEAAVRARILELVYYIQSLQD